MTTLLATHGRLLVDNMEYRWVAVKDLVLSVGRVARAVNCGAIAAEVIDLERAEVDAAAAFSHSYKVKPYAKTLTPVTARVPLLVCRTAQEELMLLDGRQRAAKAFETAATVKAYAVELDEAVRVGQHPSSTEAVRLFSLIKDPSLRQRLARLLDPLRSRPIHIPILDHLRGMAGGDAALLRALDTAGQTSMARDGYRVLHATGKRPVIYDQASNPDDRRFRQVMLLVQYRSKRRPKDGWRETRVTQLYRYYALRLATLEDLLLCDFGDVTRGISSQFAKLNDYRDKAVDDTRTERQRRTDAIDCFLRDLWDALELVGPSERKHETSDRGVFGSAAKRFACLKDDFYLSFAQIEKEGAEVLKATSDHAGVDALRRALKAELLAVQASNIHGGLLLRRELAISEFAIFACAYVRMRQWRTARIALIDMEQGAEGDLNPGVVENVARWDLEHKSSLVSFQGMICFSLLSGVVATDIWPLHLEYNPLFEVCAVLYRVRNKPRLGRVDITPTAVEAYLHRWSIHISKQTDSMSVWWTLIFMAAEHVGLTPALMRDCLVHIDSRQGGDRFDREENPYGARLGE